MVQLYILNSSKVAEKTFDNFFSLIWTERYDKISDFTIECPPTATNRSLLKEGVILMLDESDQPQVIETVQLKKSANGEKKWVVKGRDLTSWMELRGSPYDRSYGPSRVSNIAYVMINEALVNPTNDADKIQDMQVRNSATDTVEFQFETTSTDLMDDVMSILSDNNCAVRCERVGSQANGYNWRYYIYNGATRNIIFSDRDDTLINTQTIRSTKKWRTMAVVKYKPSNKEGTKTATRIVYANGGSAGSTGLNRRVIRVDATGVNPDDYPGDRLTRVVDRMGRAALGKAKKINAIDGEVPAYTKTKYGTNYKLGDIVKFKSDDNVSTNARVTEYIWIVDETGSRQYPTVEVADDITI